LFDTAEVDWASELPRLLSEAVTDESGEGYFSELESVAVSLNDGRAMVYHGRYAPYGYLPVLVDWVEDQVVITASATEKLEPGDVVSALDGVGALKNLQTWESRTSGSAQRKRTGALLLFGAGEVGDVATLSVRRGDVSFDVEVPRGGWNERPSEASPEPIDELEEGILYVDLTRAATSEVEQRMPEIAVAGGVIFDLRGTLRTDHRVLSHLLSEPDLSTSWAQASEIIRPDRVDPIGWRDRGWTTLPAEPKINGKAAFLVDGRTIGEAEAVADLVAVHDLAEVVGQPTAGAAGDVNLVTLPGRFELRWTGVRTVSRDGGTLNLTGVQPTVEVERTIQGIRDGRDEFLEQALRIVAAPRPEDPASP
jgi:C-terminal processing protease CtpA/Prc